MQVLETDSLPLCSTVSAGARSVLAPLVQVLRTAKNPQVTISLNNGAGSVADSHHFDADPDPAFHFDADPDPDPGSGSYCQLGMVKKKFSILVNNKTQMG